MKLKLAILPLCLIALNAFAFEGTVKQTIKNFNSTGNDVTMTWYIGAHGCRIDMTASGKDLKAGNTVLLIDPAARLLKTYEAGSTGQKVYFQVPAASITGDATNVSVAKTTDTRKIQGYNCEKWTVTSAGSSYDVWITRDIDFDAPVYRDFFKGSMEIQALAQQGVKGFPLLTESRTGANASSVDNVSVHTISSETLSVPSDYTLYLPQQPAPSPKK